MKYEDEIKEMKNKGFAGHIALTCVNAAKPGDQRHTKKVYIRGNLMHTATWKIAKKSLKAPEIDDGKPLQSGTISCYDYDKDRTLPARVNPRMKLVEIQIDGFKRIVALEDVEAALTYNSQNNHST